MIDSKQAVQTAMLYLKEVFGYENPNDNIFNIVLEEILIEDYKDIKDCWFITFSFYKKNTEITGNVFQNITTHVLEPFDRKLKTVIVSPEGKVLGMKIREVEYAF